MGLLLSFVIGAITVVALEAVGLWVFIRRLDRKLAQQETKTKTATASASASHLSLGPSLYQKQGTIWILEPDKAPKLKLDDKVPAEKKKIKEILEVTPLRKNARIKDHCLILMEPDVPSVEISLRGCTVAAVSATDLPSRKWAKRYPLKLESKDSAIYNGSQIIYLFLETSWEKESWCKVLRLASSNDEEKTTLFSKLSMEFKYYLASLNAGYPSFMKPSAGPYSESTDRSVKLDDSSRVRQLLKKLTKKASRCGQDYKPSGPFSEERKLSLKSHSFQDKSMPNGSDKPVTLGNLPSISSDNTNMTSSGSTYTEQGTGSHISGSSETDSKESNDLYIDEGTLCLNLLISRLFFDAKMNVQLKSSLHNGIQRALSNMRIPSYIGEVTCTYVDPGPLPPCVLAMRVLPSDMNELWSLEIDVEYLGGILLDIETRLELRELEFEEEELQLDGNTDSEVTSDLLKDFKYTGEQLKLPEKKIDGHHDRDQTNDSRSFGSAPSQGSRWKSVLHSISKQVSQVPLSLRIRVSSLCGTMRVLMKPPPSDQIWFGFTSMPDIQFNLESYVGGHKITNARLALFLISRFKAGIHESLVLPNTESITIPWMLAEKDDWVPRKAAPFMWHKSTQDSTSYSETSCTRSEVEYEISKNVGPSTQVTGESVGACASGSSSMDESSSHSHEVRAPDERMPESIGSSFEPSPNPKGQVKKAEDEDTVWRSSGTRERMRGLGKKMGEKLEVRRRHLEEKGRSFVEKMRGP